MYCKNCGKEVSAEDKFCSNCGERLTPESKPFNMPSFDSEPANSAELRKEEHKFLKNFHVDEFNWDLAGFPQKDNVRKTDEVNFNWDTVLEAKQRERKGLGLSDEPPAPMNTESLFGEDDQNLHRYFAGEDWDDAGNTKEPEAEPENKDYVKGPEIPDMPDMSEEGYSHIDADDFLKDFMPYANREEDVEEKKEPEEKDSFFKNFSWKKVAKQEPVSQPVSKPEPQFQDIEDLKAGNYESNPELEKAILDDIRDSSPSEPTRRIEKTIQYNVRLYDGKQEEYQDELDAACIKANENGGPNDEALQEAMLAAGNMPKAPKSSMITPEELAIDFMRETNDLPDDEEHFKENESAEEVKNTEPIDFMAEMVDDKEETNTPVEEVNIEEELPVEEIQEEEPEEEPAEEDVSLEQEEEENVDIDQAEETDEDADTKEPAEPVELESAEECEEAETPYSEEEEVQEENKEAEEEAPLIPELAEPVVVGYSFAKTPRGVIVVEKPSKEEQAKEEKQAAAPEEKAPNQEPLPSKEENNEEKKDKLSFGDVFNDDSNDDNQKQKKKGGALKVLAIILVILIIVELGLVLIQYFAPESKVSGMINEGYNKVLQLFEKDDGKEAKNQVEEESNTIDAFEPVLTEALKKYEGETGNVEAVKENTELAFGNDIILDLPGFDKAGGFMDTEWYEDEEKGKVTYGDCIADRLISFYSDYVDYRNNDEVDMSKHFAEDVDISKELPAIKQDEKIFTIKCLEIGQIKTSEDGMYVLVQIFMSDESAEGETSERKVIFLTAEDKEVKIERIIAL